MGFRVTHNHLPALKRIVGTVVSTNMDRTAVVHVERVKMHPRTRKFIRLTTKYFCHDHHEVCGVGDRVEIRKCAPVSKKKYFTVVDILHRQPQLDGEPFPFSKLRRHPDLHLAEAAAKGVTAGQAAAAGAAPAKQQEQQMQ